MFAYRNLQLVRHDVVRMLTVQLLSDTLSTAANTYWFKGYLKTPLQFQKLYKVEW